MKMVKDKDGDENKGLFVSINEKVLWLCKIIMKRKTTYLFAIIFFLIGCTVSQYNMYTNSLQSELKGIRGRLQNLTKLENELEDIRGSLKKLEKDLEDIRVNTGKEIKELKEKCDELNCQRIESLVDEKVEKFREGIYRSFETLKDEAKLDEAKLDEAKLDEAKLDEAKLNDTYIGYIRAKIRSIYNKVYDAIQNVFSFMPKRIDDKS